MWRFQSTERKFTGYYYKHTLQWQNTGSTSHQGLEQESNHRSFTTWEACMTKNLICFSPAVQLCLLHRWVFKCTALYSKQASHFLKIYLDTYQSSSWNISNVSLNVVFIFLHKNMDYSPKHKMSPTNNGTNSHLAMQQSSVTYQPFTDSSSVWAVALSGI